MEMHMVQTILKNENRLDGMLFNFKIYNKSTLIKTVWLSWKDGKKQGLERAPICVVYWFS